MSERERERGGGDGGGGAAVAAVESERVAEVMRRMWRLAVWGARVRLMRAWTVWAMVARLQPAAHAGSLSVRVESQAAVPGRGKRKGRSSRVVSRRKPQTRGAAKPTRRSRTHQSGKIESKASTKVRSGSGGKAIVLHGARRGRLVSTRGSRRLRSRDGGRPAARDSSYLAAAPHPGLRLGARGKLKGSGQARRVGSSRRRKASRATAASRGRRTGACARRPVKSDWAVKRRRGSRSVVRSGLGQPQTEVRSRGSMTPRPVGSSRRTRSAGKSTRRLTRRVIRTKHSAARMSRAAASSHGRPAAARAAAMSHGGIHNDSAGCGSGSESRARVQVLGQRVRTDTRVLRPLSRGGLRRQASPGPTGSNEESSADGLLEDDNIQLVDVENAAQSASVPTEEAARSTATLLVPTQCEEDRLKNEEHAFSASSRGNSQGPVMAAVAVGISDRLSEAEGEDLADGRRDVRGATPTREDDEPDGMDGAAQECAGGGAVDLADAEALEQIRNLAQDPLVADRIIKSIAPSVRGHPHVKTAVALSLFGGQTKKVNGDHRIRGDINILLLGDPSTAKSQMLKYVETTAPCAVFATANSASAVGLTASVHKHPVTNECTIEGGALVLADQGVCLIDEFDQMSEQDRTTIHEAMEQQSVSVSKAGITTSLNARCAVVAAASPVGGRYDPTRTFSENVHLADPILQRFDLLCVLQDNVIPVHDERPTESEVASHSCSRKSLPIARSAGGGDGAAACEIETDVAGSATDMHRLGTGGSDGGGSRSGADQNTTDTDIIPHDLLRKYISYAREHVRPQLDDPACQESIVSLYADLRRQSHASGGGHVTVRLIESVIRLSEAHARMQLRDKMSAENVSAAIRTVLESYLRAQKDSVMHSLRSGLQKYLAVESKRDMEPATPVL